MKLLSVVISIVCLLGLLSCARPKDLNLKEGRKLEQQGEYLEAQKNYDKMPFPEARDTYQHNLNHLYGDIMQAMIAQQENPTSAEVYYELGKAYYNKAQSFPKGQAIQPNQGLDLEAYFAEQRSHFQTRAEGSLKTAVEYSKGYAALPSGQMQVQAQPSAESQATYEQTLLLEGKLYEEMGRPEDAMRRYQELLDANTTSPIPFYRLGILLYDRGQTAEGLQLAEEAVTRAPDDPNAQYILGILYAREARDAEAIIAFQMVMCINRGYPEPYDKVAQIYLNQNNLIDAERVLRAGLINNPTSRKIAGFLQAVQSILDAQQEEDSRVIDEQLAAENKAAAASVTESGKTAALSPELQIRRLELQLRIIQRQWPYGLPCIQPEDEIFFVKQTELLQQKIKQLTQSLQSTQ